MNESTVYTSGQLYVCTKLDRWSTQMRLVAATGDLFTIYELYLNNGRAPVLGPKQSKVVTNPAIRSTTSSVV